MAVCDCECGGGGGWNVSETMGGRLETVAVMCPQRICLETVAGICRQRIKRTQRARGHQHQTEAQAHQSQMHWSRGSELTPTSCVACGCGSVRKAVVGGWSRR